MEELTPYVAHGNSLCEIKGKLSVSLYYCKEMYYANPCNSSLAECFIGNIHGYEFFFPTIMGYTVKLAHWIKWGRGQMQGGQERELILGGNYGTREDTGVRNKEGT